MWTLLDTDSYHSPNYHKYTAQNRLYRWHLKSVLDTLHEIITGTEPSTVLDAGCGEGFAVDYLARKSPQIRFTGVDISDDAVGFAERNFGTHVHFRKGSVFRLPFSDRSFDTVLCCEVLEHLDDPDRAIRELNRVARRNVVLSVPLEPYFEWLNRTGRRLGLSVDPGHVNHWTTGAFRSYVSGHFPDAMFRNRHTYQFARASRVG
jgi:ubiquinone/menaquinone biosynthesis C-methylase UbiE